jgi:hypothetical protein
MFLGWFWSCAVLVSVVFALIFNRGGELTAALLDGAASANAVKALGDACASHSVPLVRTGAYRLGDAIGKPGRMAAAVTDGRMAAKIIELSDADSIGDA